MTTDIVERLRATSTALPSEGDWIEVDGDTIPNNVCTQAANEIERLRVENKRICGMPTASEAARNVALEKEIERLRKIEAAARNLIDVDDWDNFKVASRSLMEMLK